uniref:Rapid alkalinization factor 1 n=1 Tax=Leersia perrieri TaxID=77586 RepID=A0A0D9Y020_9ORYZ
MAARFIPILLLLLVLAVSASASSLSAGAGGDHLQLGILSSGSECRGTVAECLAGEEEDEEEAVGSASGDAQRRVLAGRGRGRGRYSYISYGALRRDTVPCSQRGASYYNCRPGGSANPYQRGCSRITRCRG